MRIRIILTTLLFLSTSAVVQAQSESIPSEKAAVIDQLLAQTGQSGLQVGEQFAGLFLQQFAGMMKQQNPDLDDEAIAIMSDAISDVLLQELSDGNALNELMYPIYAKHFTKAELEEWVAFNATPLGQKLLEVSPAITAEGMQAGQKFAEGVLPKISAEIEARLKAGGY